MKKEEEKETEFLCNACGGKFPCKLTILSTITPQSCPLEIHKDSSQWKRVEEK